jgi:hypothetical protein
LGYGVLVNGDDSLDYVLVIDDQVNDDDSLDYVLVIDG